MVLGVRCFTWAKTTWVVPRAACSHCWTVRHDIVPLVASAAIFWTANSHSDRWSTRLENRHTFTGATNYGVLFTLSQCEMLLENLQKGPKYELILFCSFDIVVVSRRLRFCRWPDYTPCSTRRLCCPWWIPCWYLDAGPASTIVLQL